MFGLKSFVLCVVFLFSHFVQAGAVYEALETNKGYAAVENLLSQGYSPDEPNEEGDAPLHYVLENYSGVEFERMFKLLIRYNANVNVQARFGNTPLIILFQNKEDDELKLGARLLMDASADPSIRNYDSDDAFDVAEEKGYTKKEIQNLLYPTL